MDRAVVLLAFLFIAQIDCRRLKLGVFLPSLNTNRWTDVLRATELALSQINNDTTLLNGIELEAYSKTTNCDINEAFAAADELARNNVLAYLGDNCYDGTLGISFASNARNIMHLTTTTSSTEFSDKAKYPLLSRASPSGEVGLNVVVEFLRAKDFRRIALFYTSDRRESRDQFTDLVTTIKDTELGYVKGLPTGFNFQVASEALDSFAIDAGRNTRVIFLIMEASFTSDLDTFLFQAVCQRQEGLSLQFFRPVEEYIFIFSGQFQPTPPPECGHIKLLFVNIPLEKQRVQAFDALWYSAFKTRSYSNVAIFTHDAIMATALTLDTMINEKNFSAESSTREFAIEATRQVRHVHPSQNYRFYAGSWSLDAATGDRLRPSNLNMFINGTIRQLMTWDPVTKNVSVTPVIDELPSRGFPPDIPELRAERSKANARITWRWFPTSVTDTPIRSFFTYYAPGNDPIVYEIVDGSLELSVTANADNLDRAHCGSVIIETDGGFSLSTKRVCAQCFIDGHVVSLSSTGVYRCKPCPPGYIAVGPQCMPCPQGTYNNEYAATECKFCNIDEYQPNEASASCLACPENAERFYGRDEDSVILEEDLIIYNQITDCSCKYNFYPLEANTTGVNCRECPDGGFCMGGTAGAYPTKGYWGSLKKDATKNLDKVKFHACDDDRCKGGIDFECYSELRGRLCNEVKMNQAFFFAGRKYPCVGSTSLRRKLFGLVLVISACISWLLLNYYVSSKYLIIDVALRNAQLAAQIFQLFSVPWPHTVQKILGSALTFLSFEADLVSPNCFVKYRPHQRLVWQLSLTGLFLCYYHSWILYAIIFHTKMFYREGFGRIFDHYQGSFGVKYSKTVRQLISILLVQHPTITEAAFATFHCRDLAPGPIVMDEDPSVPCSSPRRIAMVIISALVISIYTVGLPLCIAIYLKHKELTAHGLHEEHVIARFGITFEYYIEQKSIIAFLLYQRTTLVVIIGTFFATAKSQLILTVLLIFFSTLLMCRLPFFKNWRLATAEFVLLINSICICIAGILLLLNSKKKAIIIIFSAALISAFIVAFLALGEALDIHRQSMCRNLLKPYARTTTNSLVSQLSSIDDDKSKAPSWVNDMVTRYGRSSSSTFTYFNRFEVWLMGSDVLTKASLPLPLQELTNSFASNKLVSLLKNRQHIMQEEHDDLSLWLVAKALCPFVVDSSPISFYSSDSRSQHWRALANVPGLLDYVCFKIDDHRREILFSVLVDLQRHKDITRRSSEAAYRLVTTEDRGAILYALCSMNAQDYKLVRRFMDSLDPTTNYSTKTNQFCPSNNQDKNNERAPVAEQSSTLSIARRVSRIGMFRQLSSAQVHGTMQAAQNYLEVQEDAHLNRFVSMRTSSLPPETKITLPDEDHNKKLCPSPSPSPDSSNDTAVIEFSRIYTPTTKDSMSSSSSSFSSETKYDLPEPPPAPTPTYFHELEGLSESDEGDAIDEECVFPSSPPPFPPSSS